MRQVAVAKLAGTHVAPPQLNEMFELRAQAARIRTV